MNSATAQLPAQIAELQHAATLLSDVNDIKRLQRIYGYYLDRSDWDNVLDLLTEDATAEYGSGGVYVGKAHIKALLYAIGYGRSGLPPGLIREHTQVQPVVDIAADGLTAKGRWRVLAILGQQGEYGRWQTGPYENEYRKEGGRWKISKIRWSETFTVPFEGGWKTQLTRSNLADRKMPAPDRPPTSNDGVWPAVSLPPYHYQAADIGRPCCIPGDGVKAAPAAPVSQGELSTRLAALQSDLSRLQDERDIQILQRTYGYYVDKNLWTQVSDLFTDDGTLEIGGRGVFVGKKRVLAYLRFLGEPVYGRIYDHTQLQPVVDVSSDGMTAKGRWRALIFTGEYQRTSVLGDAIYENEYRKDGGKWKISRLHAYFIMYTTMDKGWHQFPMPNTRPEKALPPDRPPTVVYDTYPGVLIAPNHFANPVTGPAESTAAKPDPAKGAEPVRSPAAIAAQLKRIRRQLERLADAEAIENLQNAYGFYMDKWQWRAAAGLFAEDATLESAQSGVYVGRSRIRQSFDLLGPEGLHQGEVNDRLQYQPVIHVDDSGNSAKARVREMQILGRYGQEAFIGGGIQENEYVKRDGVWKISKLHLYTTFLADLEKGWSHGALPVPGPSDKLPPDRPPTVVYQAFPTFFAPPFHYDNPVTGQPPLAR